MLFSFIIVVIIAVVAYFHYLQGFFSAGLSAIISVVAALIAVGYHETIGPLVNGGQYSDYVTAVMLVSIYAVSYIILRTVFDKAIPGNVRFPLLVDRIGGAAMGAVAGLFAAGVVAIAAQSLGFGPSIAMHSRYPIVWGKTTSIRPPDSRRPDDATFDELDAAKFTANEPGDAQGLWVPADEIVLNVVKIVSAPGASLDSGRPFTSIHPDYLQELFGQRVGIQSGSKHTAMENTVEILGIYTASDFPQDDPERWERDGDNVGVRGSKNLAAKIDPLPPVFRPGPGKMILVIRAQFDGLNADSKSNLVAYTPASVRLVVGGKNYFPVGTLEGGRILYRNAPDDLLFTHAGKAADLVFEVPRDEALAAGDKSQPRLAEGILFEFKRFARIWLTDKPVAATVEPPGDKIAMVRKEGTRVGSEAAVVKGPLSFEGTPQVSPTLFTSINIEGAEGSSRGEKEWGTYTLRDRKMEKIVVNPVRTIEFMSQGRSTHDEFFVPDGQRMVQISARPASKEENKWAWADALGDYQVMDGAGTKYPVHGVFARVRTGDSREMLAGAYDATRPLRSIAPDRNMRPTDVTLLFLVPAGVELKSVEYRNDVVRSMNLRVQ